MPARASRSISTGIPSQGQTKHCVQLNTQSFFLIGRDVGGFDSAQSR
uniref:Uncharacterized protein n=1 Tax=Arundo donax TaxID=35708 RepID=A0A0A9EW40_ARUDO